jgi:hypothetical protein
VTTDRFTELDRLPARIGEAAPVGALMPAVSGGALMLEGAREEGAEFPFGANVASVLILDLAEDRTLAGVETLIPLESWEQTDEDLAPRAGARPGRVLVEGPTVELYVPDAEPRFLVNGEQGRLLVELGERGPGTEWVRLSERCHALVGDGSLVGLAVQLG